MLPDMYRIPVSKLDKVNEELSRLCDNGTIKPVMQPTDWLSNILVKEKPNGNIRICIDPSETINKAIRRPVYTIPTIEEKLPLLKNAKVFTIVDVLEAFHTIELDDESALSFLPPLWDQMADTVSRECCLASLRDLKNINDDSMNFFMGFLESSTLQMTFAYLGVVTP